ncbi:MAG TPA: hypothetical protein VKC54_04570 [Patescibacteria group bacterium]|nr:hypothetical protein [Patescibacteria group bacterium]
MLECLRGEDCKIENANRVLDKIYDERALYLIADRIRGVDEQMIIADRIYQKLKEDWDKDKNKNL